MRQQFFYQWLSLSPIIYLYWHTSDTIFTAALTCISLIWCIATASLLIK